MKNTEAKTVAIIYNKQVDAILIIKIVLFYGMVALRTIENKLVDLGINLPNPSKPSGISVQATTVGNLVYTSWTGCDVNGEVVFQVYRTTKSYEWSF